MFYTIYKITNLLNNKIYIGKHIAKTLDDGYMGSGKHLKHSMKKYGIDNFSKEILFVFDNEIDMNLKESELVTENFCLREDTYNICIGGQGGFSYLNINRLNRSKWHEDTLEEHMKNMKSKAVEKWKNLYENDKSFRLKMTEIGEKGRTAYKEKYPEGAFKGKTHTDATKKIMSDKAKLVGIGENNSQFGTMWITNGTDNTKIKKEEIIPEGWYKGRVGKK